MRIYRTVTRLLFLASILVCLPAIAAKQTKPPDDPGYYAARFIIKFSAKVTDPASPALVQDLSQDAGVPLVYVRPMSGGAHIYGIRQPISSDCKRAITQLLSTRDDVLYIEPDRILRHRSGS